jgi:hypothetical protein
MTTHVRVRAWMVLAVFLLAYNIEFRHVPGSSAYLGLAIVVVAAWSRPLPLDDRTTLVLLGGSVGFAALSGLRWLAGGSFDLVLRAQYLLMFGVVAGILLAIAMDRSWSLVLRVTTYATAIQSVFVFLTYGLAPARRLVSRLLVESGNISLLYGGRPSGFSNSGGSLLSVTQGFGACAGMMWLWTIPRGSVTRKQRWLVTACVVGCVASSLVAGRSGAIVLVIFLLARSLQYPRLVAAAIALVLAGVGGLVLLPSLLPESSRYYSQALDSRRIIVDLLKLWKGQFFDVYRDMPWPRFGSNLAAGDPDYFAPSRPTHDAGVVQTLGSVGVPGMLLAYFPIAWMGGARSSIARVRGWTLLCLIVLLLEMKEPFIFKGPNLMLIVALGLCPVATKARRPAVGPPPEAAAADATLVAVT